MPPGEPGKVNLRLYPIEVTSGQSTVKGPYAAQTIPVSVENDCVVVEI
jgi:3-phenylpropionate/trans-cinnamate dioxygenase ferredoxin subunit